MRHCCRIAGCLKWLLGTMRFPGTHPVCQLRPLAFAAALLFMSLSWRPAMAALSAKANLVARSSVLLKIPYGTKANQLAIEVPPERTHEDPESFGPSGLWLCSGGSIAIADYKDGCVKRFDRRGRVLARTEGDLENLSDMVVSRSGAVCAYYGDNLDQLSAFRADGRKAWTVDTKALVTPYGKDFGIISLYAAPCGQFAVLVSGHFASTAQLLLLNGKGSVSRVVKGDLITEDGRVLECKPGAGGAPQVSIQTPGQRAAGSVLLRTDRRVLPLFRGDPHPSFDPALGPDGRLYGIMELSRGIVGEPIYEVLPTAPVYADAVVLSYGTSGKVVAVAQFSVAPFSRGNTPDCAFDAEGRVYYLRAQRDHVEVIRCTMVPISQVKLPALPPGSHPPRRLSGPPEHHSDYGPG